MQYIRTLILLTALVLLPALAISWRSLPTSVQNVGTSVKQTVQQWFVSLEPETPSYRAPVQIAAPLSPSISDDSKTTSGMADMMKTTDTNETDDMTETPFSSFSSSSSSISSSFSSLPTLDTSSSTPITTQVAFTEELVPIPMASSIPQQYPQPYSPHQPSQQPQSFSPSSPPSSPSPISRYAQLERELQQLGASYYCLERWGTHDEYFKFSCFVPESVVRPRGVSGDTGLTQRHFQAIDIEDIQAIQSVLGQIHAWRTAAIHSSVVR